MSILTINFTTVKAFSKKSHAYHEFLQQKNNTSDRKDAQDEFFIIGSDFIFLL